MAPARDDAEGREASLAAIAVPVHVSEAGRTREDQNEVVDTQETLCNYFTHILFFHSFAKLRMAVAMDLAARCVARR